MVAGLVTFTPGGAGGASGSTKAAYACFSTGAEPLNTSEADRLALLVFVALDFAPPPATALGGEPNPTEAAPGGGAAKRSLLPPPNGPPLAPLATGAVANAAAAALLGPLANGSAADGALPNNDADAGAGAAAREPNGPPELAAGAPNS
jgi:hypothetical protein